MNEAVKVIWEEVEVDVPINVINKPLYAEWYVRKERVANHPNRYIFDSKGKKYDLTQPKAAIIRGLRNNGCSKKEIEELSAKTFYFGSERGKLTSIYRKINSLDGNSYNQDSTLNVREAEIIDLFGRYCTEAEVHKIVTQEWGYEISFGRIRQFAVKNREKIIETQRQYEEEYNDISIGSKRSRLGKLNYLLQVRQQIFEKGNKIEDSREIRAILQDARKEVEGDTLKIDVSGKIDIEATLSVEYQENVLKGMTVQQLVLSRVAARLGVNPTFLMSRLVNSYYSKFNGFRRNSDLENSVPLYPSSINYDFDDLIKKNIKIEEKIEHTKDLPDIQDVEIVEDVKTKLLKAIKAKQESVNKLQKK